MKIIIKFLIITFSLGLSAQNYTRDKKEIAKEIKARNKAVHVFNDWMRDPFITLAPDGNYYLTVTQHGDTLAGGKIVNDGVPLYKSENLIDWKFDSYIYTITKDASNASDYLAEREKINKNPTIAYKQKIDL